MGDGPASGRDGEPPVGGYEWTCPFCESSRLNATGGDAGMENAIRALKTHVMASADAEHGPRNEFPADFDALALSEYVVEVDGRGDSRGPLG